MAARRDTAEIRAARRRARAIAQGREQLPRQITGRFRAIQERKRREGGAPPKEYTLEQMVEFIGNKPAPEPGKPYRQFRQVGGYSESTVRYMVEHMDKATQRIAISCTSDEYRARASVQGRFNYWWYHANNLNALDELRGM